MGAVMPSSQGTVATVNGVPLHAPGEQLDGSELRQRACSELLRQAAQAQGLLGVDDSASSDGVLSQDAVDAIEALLERELLVPEPDDDACRRHHAAHPQVYSNGERVLLRHLLLAVTPGVNLAALRQRAEQLLLELRCADDPQAFATQARQWSNCPSAAQGGDLGWLRQADCAPEFAREVFGHSDVGVLPRLVHSRFGLHVVEVLQRQPGEPLAYDQVHGAVRLALHNQAWAVALRHYLLRLAARSQLHGVPIEGDDSPLQQ